MFSWSLKISVIVWLSPEEYNLEMELSSVNEFDRIYRDKIWGKGSRKSPLSGPGSNPDNASVYVNFVERTVGQLGICSVVDIGHGDWSMWRDYGFENTKYLGFDVVEGLSDRNTRMFGGVNREFKKSSQGFDFPPSDLLTCKDVLQHLSFDDIDSIMSQFHKYKYLILCNDIRLNVSLLSRLRFRLQLRARFKALRHLSSPFYSVTFPSNNMEIQTGDYRGLDLDAPRFNSRLADFEVVQRIDYDAEHSKGTRKRIFLLRNLSTFGSKNT
jgi:hypothetical protein